MTTPVDTVVRAISSARYHNHRNEGHSNSICADLWSALVRACPSLANDFDKGVVDWWLNVEVPGLTHRVDFMLCEITETERSPSLERARLCLENKSVVTAHGKNRRNRHSDLSDFLRVVQGQKPETIVLGTVLVGTALRYLNVPDRVKPACDLLGIDFETEVLPRLSTGDLSLWAQFKKPSVNQPDDPRRTVDLMRSLPVRKRGFTHEVGFDFLLIAPLFVDNVSPPHVERDNPFGIDVDRDYAAMVSTICRAYNTRWHANSR